jgi:hypothetical protein
MPGESITCVGWRARSELEKRAYRQTMSATAFIVSGMCHDAEQQQFMIEYGYNMRITPRVRLSKRDWRTQKRKGISNVAIWAAASLRCVFSWCFFRGERARGFRVRIHRAFGSTKTPAETQSRRSTASKSRQSSSTITHLRLGFVLGAGYRKRIGPEHSGPVRAVPPAAAATPGGAIRRVVVDVKRCDLQISGLWLMGAIV